ncbi:MAG: acyl-CoA dehydrogenase family protein [Phycisphaerales bacterium]|nr:acyl-CoA dehydrogenase family protein [Phycisphaerales bacterium]
MTTTKHTDAPDNETDVDITPIDTSKMSEGKRAALELAESSRETSGQLASFAAGIFMGNFPWKLISTFPEQSAEDAEKGRHLHEEIERILREQTDPDAIDRDGEIPDEVMKAFAELGAFGIKIPTEYGGLGLSQVNYSRAATILGSYCGNLTALISAHQSIGIPQPLIMFGTEEQKKTFLPRVAAGEISAFALTETSVGSDPAKMETTAEPSEDGEHFILNGEKLWCTNGTRAGLLVVMARTPDKVVGGKSRRQITAFIVETDSPGLEITYRCRFMGLKSLYNAVITLDNVKVPRSNIILGEGKGLKVALSTLNTGRLTLPAACTGTMKRCVEITRRWSNERVQWGSEIGKHAAIADKLARMASTTFAVESMSLLTSALVDGKKTDIRLEAAMSKMFGTEAAWEIIDETMQARGGRGFETSDSLRGRGEDAIPIERMMRDSRINTIFEGSSEIMRLFIAREALDPHLAGAGSVMNPKLPMGKRIAAAFKALGFYGFWYPKQWWPFAFGVGSGMDSTLARHVKYARKASRRLARRLFHSMVRFGPALEREQILLGDCVDIGTEIFAISAACSRAQAMIKSGTERKKVVPLVDFFCREAKSRIEESLRHARKNNNSKGYKVARSILDGDYGWLEDGIVRWDPKEERNSE